MGMIHVISNQTSAYSMGTFTKIVHLEGPQGLYIPVCRQQWKKLKFKSVEEMNKAGYKGDHDFACFISYLIKEHNCRPVEIREWEVL